jgi:hypothetical protein
MNKKIVTRTNTITRYQDKVTVNFALKKLLFKDTSAEAIKKYLLDGWPLETNHWRFEITDN